MAARSFNSIGYSLQIFVLNYSSYYTHSHLTVSDNSFVGPLKASEYSGKDMQLLRQSVHEALARSGSGPSPYRSLESTGSSMGVSSFADSIEGRSRPLRQMA